MDIQLDQIFRKSETGIAEIKGRTGQLTLRERAALILTDATSTVEAMQSKLGSDAAMLLLALYEKGYVESLPTRGKRSASTAPVPPLRSEPNTFSATLPAALFSISSSEAPSEPPLGQEVADMWAQFAPLRALALQRLTPHFGPDVVVILKPLLKARTLQDYLAAFDALERKMQVNLGRTHAAKVLDGLRPATAAALTLL